MVTVPVLDLLILLRVGAFLGFINTVAVIIITAALGATLAKQQGLQTIANIKRSMNQGEIPTTSLVDGLLILIAGVVLMTPGLLTDAFGFFLLIPPCRALLRSYAVKAFKNNIVMVTPQPGTSQHQSRTSRPSAADDIRANRPSAANDIIDVKATTVDDDKKD